MISKAIQATLTIFSSDLCNRINEMIAGKGQFTTVTDNEPADINPIAISLFCLEPYAYEDILNITHIGIIAKGQRVATGQNRLKAFDLIEFEPIKQDDLLALLPANLKRSGKDAFSIGYKKVPPRTGEALLEAVIKLRPDQSAAIENLIKRHLTARTILPNGKSEDLAAEKDAVSLCLDIFGVDRSETLRKWQAVGDRVGTSFLSGFNQFSAYEDDLIAHDMRTLPGWTIVSQNMAGYAEFSNSNNEKLVVINANRKPVEKAMGVDLIYFHRKYESFTLVQYKMMDRQQDEARELFYNPNQKSHQDELLRMQKLHSLIGELTNLNTLKDYRISECAIFFKLCKKIEFQPNNAAIVPGAYIPLKQWEILLTDESTKGPKGGCQIGYHTLGKRYLGTQTFIDLVQKGFIGTTSIASAKIALFIEDAVASGHSVMYAVDNRKMLTEE